MNVINGKEYIGRTSKQMISVEGDAAKRSGA